MSTPDTPKPALPPRPTTPKPAPAPRPDTTPPTPPATTDPEPDAPAQGRKRVPAGVVAAILVVAVLIGMAALTGHLLPRDTGDATPDASATPSATIAPTTGKPSPTGADGKTATGGAVQIWDDTKSMTGSQLFRQNITKPLEDQVRRYGVTATASAPDADTVRIDLHTPDSLRGAGDIYHRKFDENPSFQRLADSIAPLCATPGPMRLNIRALTPDGTVVWQKTWTAKEA